MLTFSGRKQGGFCDGVTRRDFLKIGGLALGGLACPQILAGRGAGRRRHGRTRRSSWSSWPAGRRTRTCSTSSRTPRPSIRGEFKPIPTNVPGIEICEHMPRLAAMMDKFAVIRSIVGCRGEHAAVQCHDRLSRGHQQGPGRPSQPRRDPLEGQGPRRPGGPAVRRPLAPRWATSRWADHGDPGYLGLAHAPFTPIRRRTCRSLGRARHRRPAGSSGRKGAARAARSPAAATSTPAARWTAWTRSPAGRSTSSPRASWSTPST